MLSIEGHVRVLTFVTLLLVRKNLVWYLKDRLLGAFILRLKMPFIIIIVLLTEHHRHHNYYSHIPNISPIQDRIP